MQIARTVSRRVFTMRKASYLASRTSYIAPQRFSRVIIPQRFFNTSSIRFQEDKAEEAKQNEEQEEKVEDAEAEKSSEETTVDVAEVQAQLVESTQKLEASEAKVKELTDKMLRISAEMENVRSRAIKDVDAAKKFALQGFAKKMLDTTDNLGWALDAARSKAEAGDNADLKTLYDGVVLTETTLQNTLKSVGVEKFESLGEKFDPNLHDGLFQFQDPTKEPGTVGQVMKEGYMYNGRCLRAANVGTVTA